MRNKTPNGRDKVGVGRSAQGKDHLGVGLCQSVVPIAKTGWTPGWTSSGQ